MDISFLPACEHGHMNWCDCQTPDAYSTACHRVHSKNWPSDLLELLLLCSPSQHSPEKKKKFKEGIN